ncbi:uncharacterized protein LOC131613833 [Vicia villosa]|uniref:uncharacterized protein LOC131613833 n=1 Tax=Vicia villosa TaxID=3911 RepID=UPI00273BB39B|nr:uncharacterized protein LOC131613833 [Vicia villosa]
MVNKAVENGDFIGCNVKGKCFVDVLQFADDTLLVGDGSWKHLWVIKEVLRGFKILSGLSINYNKSKLIGININSRFLDVVTSSISCKREEKEFSFLGICIGSNPIRIKFWSPLVENIRKRFRTWKGRWLSFGGRITLLKSVLGSLPIFTLSFYLAPKKWKWRILENTNSIWYRMLKARYGDIKLRMVIEGGRLDNYCTKLVWWSDILSLEKRTSGGSFVNNDVVVACMGAWISDV